MLDCFNEHFVASGSLFDQSLPPKTYPPDANTVDNGFVGQPFSFAPFSISDVHKALVSLDINKPAGPDGLEPFLNCCRFYCQATHVYF